MSVQNDCWALVNDKSRGNVKIFLKFASRMGAAIFLFGTEIGYPAICRQQVPAQKCLGGIGQTRDSVQLLGFTEIGQQKIAEKRALRHCILSGNDKDVSVRNSTHPLHTHTHFVSLSL